MKRVLTLVMGLILLLGCGATSKEEVKTICSTNETYSVYESYEQTLVSEGDNVKHLTVKGILKFEDKESLDEVMELFNARVDEFNKHEGINAKLDRIDDTKVNDILEIDLTKTDLALLKDLGVLYIEEGSVSDYSLSQSITLAESSGLSCETVK